MSQISKKVSMEFIQNKKHPITRMSNIKNDISILNLTISLNFCYIDIYFKSHNNVINL